MKNTFNEETIAAIATPNGTGAISVIRVSGSKSLESVDRIFQGKKKLSQSPSHTIHYGRIVSPDGDLIDDVLVSVFRNPNSYTGEDSAEISTHGSPFITGKVLELLMDCDVRLAEPGEFTRRAFLNGRLDLAQAEAVADIINSRTEASLRGARNQLDGLLSARVEYLRDMLLNTSSMIELELDFAEEEVEFLSKDQVASRINSIIDEINGLLKTYSFGRVMRDGINIALAGRPNVGKSSLLNYILKESRAIVSDIPGTTRDVIREEVSLDGILLKLFDTAGIRLTEDIIEKEGVLRSREAVTNADLVLLILDRETGPSEDLYNEISTLTSPSHIIRVFNKVDVAPSDRFPADVYISARTGEGINRLFQLIKEKSFGSSGYTERTAVVSNIRHYKALKSAVEFLQNAVRSIDQGFTGEFISVDLRNAENSLNEIVGKITTDDILNNIFSKFCIGK